MIEDEECSAVASKPRRRPGSLLLRKARRHPRVLEGAIVGAIALVTLLVFSPLAEMRFAPYDLGISVYGGFRILDGFIPYVDTHTPYGPAQYYVRALLFSLFGTSIETAELEWMILVEIGIVSVYWTLRGCVGRLPALTLTLIVGILAFYLPSLYFIGLVLTVGCMTRYSRDRHAGWLVGAGLCIGVVGAARWDFGVYSAVTCVAALASLPLIRRFAAPSEEAPVSLWPRARDCLFLLAPAALAALPFYAPTLLTDPRALLRSIEIALRVHDYRVLPWPSLPSLVDIVYGKLTVLEYLSQAAQSFPAYAFFFLGPLNAIAVFISLWRRAPIRPGVPLIVHTLVTTLLGACLLIYTDSRAQLGHMLPSMIFMLLSLPLIFWLSFRSFGAAPLRVLVPSWGISILALLTLVPVLLLGVIVIGNQWGGPSPPEGLYTAPTLAGLSPDARGAARKAAKEGMSGAAKVPRKSLERAEDYNTLVGYIKENTAPDDFIFSGSVRHDKMGVVDVMVYFASERNAGFRDYHMDPGSTTSRDIQQQIIGDLERNDVRLLVLADRPPPQEPNMSAESSGVTDLDDYIHDNYVVRERFDQYFVLTKREPSDSPCSSTPASSGYGAVEQIEPLDGGSEVEHDGQVRIQGWATTPEGSPPIDRIEVRVEGQPVINPTIQCIPREDLAERFGQGAWHSGWQVTADLRDVEEVRDPVDVAVEAVDRDGGRHPLPIDSEAELPLAP